VQLVLTHQRAQRGEGAASVAHHHDFPQHGGVAGLLRLLLHVAVRARRHCRVVELVVALRLRVGEAKWV
jgi:hypothetical protein